MAKVAVREASPLHASAAAQRRTRVRAGLLCALRFLAALALALPAGAVAEQASQPGSVEAGRLDTGFHHSCAAGAAGSVRCWGAGGDGRLGYGNLETIGDNETPGSIAPADLGGANATALSAGGFHTCALLVDASVRCWGLNVVGELGYPNTSNIGDNEPAASGGPVDLGTSRTAEAITAGREHTCAILNGGDVRCWGYGFDGELGYPNLADKVIGDSEAPGSIGPVDLGAGQTARAISAGRIHTCAILDDASVRCWGDGSLGQLGYGNTQDVGDDEPPGSVGPVNLGTNRTAKAITAGDFHTCSLLDNGSVRCWGWNGDGQLGYGRLEFGGLYMVGDNEVPGSVGPVDLGPGRTATAISAGGSHTCARLDDASVRCWGDGSFGQLGYCNTADVGDDEVPGSAGPVPLASAVCPRLAVASHPLPSTGSPAPFDTEAAGRKAEATRRRFLHSCLGKAARHARREVRRARGLTGSRRARARRHITRHRSRLRRRCLKRWGRTPGPVTDLKASALSTHSVELTFRAAGSDGSRPPAARGYLVRFSRRPIRGARAFRRAVTLCRGSCRFPSVRVGDSLRLPVTKLRSGTTYYFAIAARDNVSRRIGPRTASVRVRTR